MRIVKNFLYNASYQVFVLLIPLITTPYLARILGPTGVGINSYTNSIIQYFILFGSVGVNLYGNRQIAFVRGNKDELTNTFFEIFLMRVFTIVLSYIGFLVFLMFMKQYRIYYLMQSISIVAAAFDVSWFFMGMEDFGVTVIRNLVIKLLTLISIFSFVRTPNDLGVYILILSLSLLLGNLTLFPKLWKYVSWPRIRKLNIWRHLKPSFLLFIPQIATQVYLVVNKTMLGSMTNVENAGYFDQSDKLIKMVLAVVTATGTVMLPHVANAFANGQSKKINKYLYTSFQFVTAISVPMMFGLVSIAPMFVPLFFTDRFLSVTPLISIESVVIILIAWSNAVGTQYLLPTKRVRAYTASVVIGALVNIVLNIPMILLWGAIGTALATVVSELVVTVYQLLSIRSQIEYKKLFKDLGKYLSAGVIMYAVIFYINIFLPSSWISISIDIVVGALVYCLFLFLFRVAIFDEAVDIVGAARKK